MEDSGVFCRRDLRILVRVRLGLPSSLEADAIFFSVIEDLEWEESGLVAELTLAAPGFVRVKRPCQATASGMGKRLEER